MTSPESPGSEDLTAKPSLTSRSDFLFVGKGLVSAQPPVKCVCVCEPSFLDVCNPLLYLFHFTLLICALPPYLC